MSNNQQKPALVQAVRPTFMVHAGDSKVTLHFSSEAEALEFYHTPPQAAPAAVAVADEREAFEKYMAGSNLSRTQFDDYENNYVHGKWEAWQARALLATGGQAKNEPAPSGMRLVNAGALQMVLNALRRDAEEGKAARGEMADELLATATGLPAQAYQDSTPQLHVGESSFEGWYAGYVKEGTVSLKQNCRDAYAAGMGDPLVVAAPQAQAACLTCNDQGAVGNILNAEPCPDCTVPAIKAQAEARDALTPAARDVLAERQRQISAEGWTPEHDDEHDEGEMCFAAAGYAAAASDNLQAISKRLDYSLTINDLVHGSNQYPWPAAWEFKPCTPRRALVKSGALILAEIERIDRAAIAAAKGE